MEEQRTQQANNIRISSTGCQGFDTYHLAGVVRISDIIFRETIRTPPKFFISTQPQLGEGRLSA